MASPIAPKIPAVMRRGRWSFSFKMKYAAITTMTGNTPSDALTSDALLLANKVDTNSRPLNVLAMPNMIVGRKKAGSLSSDKYFRSLMARINIHSACAPQPYTRYAP